jgi:hypothetical protein
MGQAEEEVTTYKCVGCTSNLEGRISCLDGKDINGKRCSDMNAQCLLFSGIGEDGKGYTKDWK